MSRLAIPKTYKLFIGGKFPRSESGRTTEVTSPAGSFVANVAKASRKDARDAVVAARAAWSGWSGASAYNRGQVLYRVAEMLEGRLEQFVAEIVESTGAKPADARIEVSAAIDCLVWHAGWTDKFAQVHGGANPVAGPFFNISVPESTGVVALVAPSTAGSSLLGLVSSIAPALTTGNAVVVLASELAPCAAMTFAEVLATSDVPGGVVNILTGSVDEVAPWLASHADVNAIDLTGAGRDIAVECERAASETLMRVVRPGTFGPTESAFNRIAAFVETKTVWHTKSLA
jgi:acyl-CoA reductase-like NAD-dependent aldehyde dehydrogenase